MVDPQITYDTDHVLCECPEEALATFVTNLEGRLRIDILKGPSVCMTMVRAEDSLEHQRFCLGEALTTECEVSVDGEPGYGVCLGDEPQRAYCIAVIDALLYGPDPVSAELQDFLAAQTEAVRLKDAEEFNLVLRTQVDFRLMEEM